MYPCVFLSAVALLLAPAQPGAAPKTRVDRDQAVKIALAHLNIDKVTKEPSAAFDLRVREGKSPWLMSRSWTTLATVSPRTRM